MVAKMLRGQPFSVRVYAYNKVYREGPDKHLCRTGFIIRKRSKEIVTKIRQKCEKNMYLM